MLNENSDANHVEQNCNVLSCRMKFYQQKARKHLQLKSMYTSILVASLANSYAMCTKPSSSNSFINMRVCGFMTIYIKHLLHTYSHTGNIIITQFVRVSLQSAWFI